jgi:hypothetical protein
MPQEQRADGSHPQGGMEGNTFPEITFHSADIAKKDKYQMVLKFPFQIDS